MAGRRKFPPPKPAGCLAFEEAAVQAGESLATIHRRLAAGVLTRVWHEGRAYIRAVDLERYLAQRVAKAA
jgi:hypothetical protein